MGFWLNLVKCASKLCMVIKPSIWQVLESLRKKEGLARYKIYAVAMGKWGPVLEKDFWPPLRVSIHFLARVANGQGGIRSGRGRNAA